MLWFSLPISYAVCKDSLEKVDGKVKLPADTARPILFLRENVIFIAAAAAAVEDKVDTGGATLLSLEDQSVIVRAASSIWHLRGGSVKEQYLSARNA